MQEVLDLFTISDETKEPDTPLTPDEHLNMAISHEVVCGSVSAKSMQFSGLLHQIPVNVLVDSGSSTSFLSTHIADQIPSLCLEPADHKVQIADGGIMHCKHVAVDCQWKMSSHKFSHSLKILQLQSYDIILGMDWLAKFSPMKVDWKDKWMQIPLNNSTAVLIGSPEYQPSELLFQLLSLQQAEQAKPDLTGFPLDIQHILLQHPAVCSPPAELPPIRPYDHSIPLIQGARPVNIRSYRYPPALKDEIEAQVSQMLQQGII